MKTFKLKADYITLGQFLKATDYIGSGGEAKFFLLDHECLVNGVITKERGKKIYPNDTVKIKKTVFIIEHDS